MTFDRAYVHIGLHKTGTTSIQQTFARHRDMLRAEHGLIYPSVSSNHSVPLFSMFCDRPAAYIWNMLAGVTSDEAVARRNAEFADNLARDLAGDERAGGGRTLVLSGEDLGLLTREGVQRFKRWLFPHAKAIRILAYVREPVAWATSHAQQQVQHGKTLEELLERDLVPRFRQRLMPWMLAFGADNITVSDFDVALQHAAGLFGHFAEQVGLPPAVNAAITPRLANASLSGEAIALLSALNAIKPRTVASPDRDASVEALFTRIKGQRFALPGEAAARTRAASAAEVTWLGNMFGLHFAEPAPRADDAPLFSSAAARDSMAMLRWELSRSGAPAAKAADAKRPPLAEPARADDEEHEETPPVLVRRRRGFFRSR
jgi:hypothetical protein